MNVFFSTLMKQVKHLTRTILDWEKPTPDMYFLWALTSTVTLKWKYHTGSEADFGRVCDMTKMVNFYHFGV